MFDKKNMSSHSMVHQILQYCLHLSGGETIRQINQQSGAHVELQRAPGPNPGEKLFNIRGNPGQIQHAIQLISEKAGLVSSRPYL